ncbi:MAG: ABC transporter ATP-binding protein [Rhizobiaceae bacterium]|nr:ABC transporter ATP-binding protein [Rhizobiaceae bacterium]
MSIFKANSVSVNRAELAIVNDVDLQVERGTISVLLGANGAGKTTLLEGLSGVIRIAGGTIELEGQPLQRARPGARARAGLGYVEQGRTVFRELTTEENLRVGLHDSADISEAYALFPELVQRQDVPAGLLSGGEQQMLVIARALLTRPKVLMIDEMSAGLAPVIVGRLMQTMRKLADEGLAILLVEQFAALALDVGDRAYVMRRGRMVYDGDCKTLLDAPDKLHDFYLGSANTEG